jgi:hypothetical protein
VTRASPPSRQKCLVAVAPPRSGRVANRHLEPARRSSAAFPRNPSQSLPDGSDRLLAPLIPDGMPTAVGTSRLSLTSRSPLDQGSYSASWQPS